MAKKKFNDLDPSDILNVDDYSISLLEKINEKVLKKTSKTFQDLNDLAGEYLISLKNQQKLQEGLYVKEKKKELEISTNISNLQKDILDSIIDISSNSEKLGKDAYQQIDLSDKLLELTRQKNRLELGKSGFLEEEYETYKKILDSLDKQIIGYQKISKIQENYNKIANDIVDSVEKFFDTTNSFLDRIPGGGFIQKLFGTEKTRATFLETFRNNLSDNMQKAMESAGESGLGMFGKLKAGAQSFGQTLSSIKTGGILLGIGLIAGAIIGIIALANKLNETIVQTSKSLGVSKEESLAITKNLNSMAMSSEQGYISQENAAEALAQINEQWGMISTISDDTLKSQMLLTKQLDLSSEASIKMLEYASQIGMTGTEYAQTIGLLTKDLNKQVGVEINFRKVIEDISEVSDDIKNSFAGNLPLLVKNVYQAKLLGTTLNDLRDTADSLMEIESSISDEMEARILTGKNLNFQRARELAIQDRLGEMMFEILKQAGSLEKFQGQRRWQQEAEAKAAGMTVEQYTKMLTRAKVLKDYGIQIDKNTGKIADNAYETLKTRVKENDVLGQSVLAEMEQETVSERLSKLKEKILTSFSALLPIAEKIISKFADIVTGLTAWLGESKGIESITKGIGVAFDVITAPIKWIVQSIGWINKQLTSLLGTESKIAGTTTLIASIFGGVAIKGLFGGISGLFKMVGGGIENLTKKIPGVGGVMEKIFPSKASDMVSKKTSLLTNIFKGLNTAAKSIGSSINALLTGVGKGIANFFKAFKLVTYSELIKGAAALTIMSGSLFLFGKAMTAFTDISWDTVLKGIVGLAALTGAVMALGLLMSSGVGTVAILAGAAAMAVIAGGLWVLGKAMQEFAKASQLFIPFFEVLSNTLIKVIETIGNSISGVITSITSGITTIFDSIIRVSAVNPLTLIGVGAGLVSIAGGLAALTASSIFNRIGKLFGGDSIFDKLSSFTINVSGIKSLEDIQYEYIVNSIDKVSQAFNRLTDSIKSIPSNNISIDPPNISGKRYEVEEKRSVEYQESNNQLISLFKEMIGEIKQLREDVSQPVYLKIGNKTVDELTSLQSLKRNMKMGMDGNRMGD